MDENKQSDRQTDRQTDRQIDRQADRQTDPNICYPPAYHHVILLQSHASNFSFMLPPHKAV
jgi:hypothetical protein